MRVVIGMVLTGLVLATSGSAAPSQPPRLGKLDRSHAGEAPPAIPIEAQDGRKSTIAAVVAAAHRPVIVNLWATWCVPCRGELPQLDILAHVRGDKLLIVPVSEDLEGWRAVNKVFAPGHFTGLKTWLDQPGNFGAKIGAAGLPVSIVYGADGREKWRVNGVPNWDSPEVQASIE